MKHVERGLLWTAAALGCALLAHAQAQPYPGRPIRILVGFAAGGGADIAARMVAPKLSEAFGQPVWVENRLGSGGAIATEAVAKAPPDGHTLLMMAAADSIQPAMRAKLPYDLPGDFSPISLVVTGPFVLTIHPTVPARGVSDLIAIARARPGSLNFASSGVGSSAHLAGALFNALAKIRIVHVPYKGAAQAVVALATGETDLAFPTITAARPLIDGGRLRALAVTTSRSTALMPGMPTLHESGVPGYHRVAWFGLVGPGGLAKDVVSKLNTAVVKAVSAPEMKSAFFKQGLEPETNVPETFTEFIRHEVQRNIRLIAAAGVKVE